MKIFIIILFFTFTIHPFSYDSAIYAAQKGDIKSADEQLRGIVVNSPDDADVLYDAGVLAHQLNNYTQAAAYFNRSAQCAESNDKNLCFQAHFNAGNAYADNKDLRLALEHYDKALAINPDNEFARHNRDRVAQMLQEQEQQKNNEQKKDKQQDQKDDQDQQDKNEQNQDDQSGDKNDQQKNDNGDDQKQENDQQQNDDSQKNGSDQESDQKSKGKQGKGSDKDSKREQGAEQGDTEKDQQNAANNKERDGKQNPDKQSERTKNEREKQQGKQHEKTPQEQDKTKSEDSIPSDGKREQGKPEASTQEGSSGASSDVSGTDSGDSQRLAQNDALKDDPWLSGILDNQELHDKAVNKKLMEARIRQHGGKNGQNCW